MSLRHANGGYLQRYSVGSTDGIPQWSGATICGWFTRRVDRNAESCWILLRGEGTTGQYAGIYTSAGDDQLTLKSTWGSGSLIVQTWINNPTFVALTMDGASIRGHATEMGAPDTGTPYTAAVTVGTDPQINMVRIGDDGYGAWVDGESHGVMAWSRVLTAAELNVQRRHRVPVDRTGMLFWLPEMGDNAAEQARDMSGAGRYFAVVGAPAVAAPADVMIDWALNR